MSIDKSLILNAAAHEHLDVHVFDSLPSTNTWLLDNPVTPGQARLCIAEEQTQGRGRRGNVWHSTPSRNITMSLGWSFAAWPAQITGISLTVGMVVVEQLNNALQLGAKVKWPNDIMVGDRKLGGILIELSGQPASACQLVIGIGLNVQQAQQDGVKSDYDWADLASLGLDLDRSQFVGELCRELVSALKAFEQNGFSRLQQAWPEYCYFGSRQITVNHEGETIIGHMAGVAADGSMILTDNNGQQHTFADAALQIRLVA